MSRPNLCMLKYSMHHVSDVNDSGLHEERRVNECIGDFTQDCRQFLVLLCKNASL